jgi:hypothetical protein
MSYDTPDPVPAPQPAPPAGVAKESFVQKTAVIVLALLCCWPVGLVFTWLHPRWSTLTKAVITAVIGAIVGLGLILTLAMGAFVAEVADDLENSRPDRDGAAQPVAEGADEPGAEDEPTEPDAEDEPTESDEKPAPEETVAQRNAVRAAENYLNYTAFSRDGLIQQLEFEGYETADAEYAVDAIEADWMEQAAKKAEDYLNYTSFSRSGLIEQLEFEGFTREQAEHGADAVGL